MGPNSRPAREAYQGHVSWAEVLRHWEALCARTGHAPLLVAELGVSVSGKPVLRGIVSCTCSPDITAAFSFGPGALESATTLPTTLLEALTGLEAAWVERRARPEFRVVMQKRGPEDEA